MAAGGAKEEIDSGLQKENPTSTYQLMQVGIVETNDIKSYAAELFTKQGEFSTPPTAGRRRALWPAYSYSGVRLPARSRKLQQEAGRPPAQASRTVGEAEDQL